ncbi:KAP family P-loop NTPase fold protein [Cerasicoccus fimbriatus]|uniref:KAP family P-loop NTPase fold protein n=1 Tax=Cerasicoccus fimbriatus TaxID=3014554 RepID=UPI0022B2E410|nr:P-loop NTPase fold protein [Cerasicoccus sp. TK19100]
MSQPKSLNLDRPAEGTPQRPDLFHRYEFSKTIAKTLLLAPSSDCLVASLEGGWGTGKTSVVKMIKTYYGEQQKSVQPVVITFNPWMFSGLGDLAKEFLLQFGSTLQLSDKGKRLNKAGDAILKYSSVFDAIKLVPGAEPWATMIKAAISAVGGSASQLGDMHTPNLEQQRSNVISALAATNKAFVVVIDDIDRLVPEEVYAILRLVKSVSDFPRVSFLLVYEHAHVVKSLELSNIPEPSAYLEKIVQLRFTLPRISRDDAYEYFDRHLAGYGEEETEVAFYREKERWRDVALEHLLLLLKTPRDYVRLTNRLNVHYPIVKGEVSFADYCCIEAIAVVEPQLYETIKNNPRAYVGHDPLNPYNLWSKHIEQTESIRKGALEAVRDEEKRARLSSLLGSLFPKTVDNPHAEADPGRTGGRIANPDNFEYAFYYTRPAHLVSLEALRDIWLNPSSREARFASIENASAGKRLLSAIDELIFNHGHEAYAQDWGPPVEPQDFAKHYIAFVESAVMPKEIGSLIYGDYRFFLKRVNYWLQKRLGTSERLSFAKFLVEDPSMLPLSCQFVNRNLKKVEKEELLPDEEMEQLNQKWLDVCAEALKLDSFWDSKFVNHILITLLRMGGAAALEAAVQRAEMEIEQKVCCLKALISGGSIDGEPYYVTESKFTFKHLNIEAFQAIANSIDCSADDYATSAMKLAYANPGISYYVKDAQRTGDD